MEEVNGLNEDERLAGFLEDEFYKSIESEVLSKVVKPVYFYTRLDGFFRFLEANRKDSSLVKTQIVEEDRGYTGGYIVGGKKGWAAASAEFCFLMLQLERRIRYKFAINKKMPDEDWQRCYDLVLDRLRRYLIGSFSHNEVVKILRELESVSSETNLAVHLQPKSKPEEITESASIVDEFYNFDFNKIKERADSLPSIDEKLDYYMRGQRRISHELEITDLEVKKYEESSPSIKNFLIRPSYAPAYKIRLKKTGFLIEEEILNIKKQQAPTESVSSENKLTVNVQPKNKPEEDSLSIAPLSEPVAYIVSVGKQIVSRGDDLRLHAIALEAKKYGISAPDINCPGDCKGCKRIIRLIKEYKKDWNFQHNIKPLILNS